MRNARGFTIAEVIVAAFILTMGLFAVMKMAPTSQRGATVSKDRLIALRIARNTIDRVRSMPFEANVSSLVGPVNLFGESIEGRPVNLEFAVKSVTKTIAPGNVTPSGFGNVTVVIEWHQGVGNANSAGNSTLTMTGGITRDP